MVLIAEEVVEEWLNQQGFFTIQGIRLGVKEMDIGSESRMAHLDLTFMLS